MLETVIIATHVLVSLGIIGFVLLQHGKGADMGASFGSGASATVFGSEGSANFLSRTTAILTAIFFVTSIGLAYYADRKSRPTFIEPAPATQQNTTAPAHADLIAPAPATSADANTAQKPVENIPATTESTSVPAKTNTIEQPAVESTQNSADAKQ